MHTYYSLFLILALSALSLQSYAQAEEDSNLSSKLMSIIVKPEAEPLKLEVIDYFVELHSGPGRGYPVFHVVEQGENITVLKRKPGWYEVMQNNGKTGWTKASQLSRTLEVTGVPVDLPTVAYGDYLKNSWRVGFTTGQLSSGELQGSDGFAVNLGYRAFSWMGIELEGAKSYSEKVSGDSYGANIMFEPFSQWRVTPYLLLGLGKMSLESQPKYTPLGVEKSNYKNYAIGANYYLGRSFVTRCEYRWYSVSAQDNSVSLEEWKIGFSTFF